MPVFVHTKHVSVVGLNAWLLQSELMLEIKGGSEFFFPPPDMKIRETCKEI